MNGLKLALAGLICAGVSVEATAEPIMTPGEQAALKVIMAEVCTEPVIFVPLSEDVEIDQRLYAIVVANETDADSAHLVSAAERNWLIESGCPAQPATIMASNERPQPALY